MFYQYITVKISLEYYGIVENRNIFFFSLTRTQYYKLFMILKLWLFFMESMFLLYSRAESNKIFKKKKLQSYKL